MGLEHAIDIEEILRRIAAGDRQAFGAVVERFQRPLFGFLGRMGLTQARVMRRIDAQPMPVPASRRDGWLTWIALAGGALLGAAQLAGFMFGIWTAATAG